MATAIEPPPKASPKTEPRSQAAPETPPMFRVALAQIAPRLGVREANFDAHLAQIKQARGQDADLIVFPELSLTGYFLRDMVPDVALSGDAPELNQLAQAAGEAAVVVGYVEESAGHRFYNAAIWAEDREIRHGHRKVYLPTYGLFDESRYFAEGDRIRALETSRFGRVGLLICEDFWHLSAIAVLQAEEIDVLVCIANSPARGVGGDKIETAETYELLCRAYAQLLGCIVVFVNRVGYEDGLCFFGGSMVVGPDGQILGQAPKFDESLLVVPIDPAELRRERLITPLARDERLLLTLEELQRIKRNRYGG